MSNSRHAIHCNDSKADFESHRDLHENIGMGKLGLLAFANLMSDSRLDELPIILETPMLDGTLNAAGEGGGVWRREIELLYNLERVGKQSTADKLEEDVAADAEVQRLFGEIKEIVEAARAEEAIKKAAKKALKAEAGTPAKGKKGGKKAAKVEEVEEEQDELASDAE